MRVKRFEDLKCWQATRALTRIIYDHSRNPKFSKDFKLIDQIRGASLSIMNNISEGFDAKSDQEFIRFLSYSRRSCSEVQNCYMYLWTRDTSLPKPLKIAMDIVQESDK